MHINMHYTPSTTHSFCIQDRLYLPCSIATTLHPPTTYTLSMHINMHYTPSNTLPTAFHNPAMHTTNTKHSWQNGTRCRDGVNVLWCCSHLVWLVFEGSIPTCACFHSENFFVSWYMNQHISENHCFFDSTHLHMEELLAWLHGCGRNARNVAKKGFWKERLTNVTKLRSSSMNFKANLFGSIPLSHRCNLDNLNMWLK